MRMCGIRLAAVLAGTLGVAQAPGAGAGAAAQKTASPTLVVLPFDTPRGDARLAWLREGAALLLSEMLAAGGDAVVPRAERVSAFERLQIPPLARLSRASSIKVGLALGVTSVVVGEVEAGNTEELAARARIIQLDSGQLLPEVRAAGAAADLYGVFARLSTALRPRPTPPVVAGGLPGAPQVFEMYVKGLVAETPSAGLAWFEQVLKAAPDYGPARLALWQLHTDAGDHTRALAVASAIPRHSSLDREGRFLSARSLISLARWDEALQVLRTLNAEQATPTVANAIGVIELRRADTPTPGRATYYFSQARELDPGDEDVCFNLGYAYWLERDAPAAAYWLREAVRRDPADGDAHFALAAALQDTGAIAESQREKELASRLSSKYAAWAARPAAATVPRGLERLHDALAPAAGRVDGLMSAAGQRDQETLARFHLEAGRRAFAREADREAIQELRRALYLSPYLAEAHLLLGRLHLRGGRVPDAIAALKIAVWSEASAPAHVALAEAHLAGGDRTAARAEIERALALDPKSVEAQQLRSRLGMSPW